MKFFNNLLRIKLNYFRANAFTQQDCWSTLQRDFIKQNPFCAICGSVKKLQVHHKLPRHLFPDLALEWENLITLCQDCHLNHGHMGDFKIFDANLEENFAKKIALTKNIHDNYTYLGLAEGRVWSKILLDGVEKQVTTICRDGENIQIHFNSGDQVIAVYYKRAWVLKKTHKL